MSIEIPVLPQNNLPNEAVPWGRNLTALTQEVAADLNNLNSTVHMNNRAMAGQMGALGRQLEAINQQQEEINAQQVELLAGRSTAFQDVEGFSITRTDPGNFGQFTRAMPIPEPFNGSRSALITVSGVITRTAPSSGLSSAGTFLAIARGSNVFVRDSTGSVGGGIGAPPGFAARAFTFTFVDQVPEGGATYNLTAYVSSNETSSITITYSNLSIVTQFQNLI